MLHGVQKSTQWLKPDSSLMPVMAGVKSCSATEQKQILRVAYPTYVGPQACSAQDDTKIGNAEIAGLKPCLFKAALFRIS
jgi:hypothetical protein